MLTKLLNNVIDSIAGKPAVNIVNLLYGKKDVNEFIIAKKLGMTINQIRNVLYKLSDENLVSFIRKKDKKKGWYTYFWTLNLERVFELIDKTIRKNIENLKNQLKSRREKNFYICRNCNIEVTEETALPQNFTCQECGEVYTLNKNEKMLKDLENNINKHDKELLIVKEELNNLGLEKAKKIEKDAKKAKAAKARERAKKKKTGKKIKKKENKKKIKKKIKKKKRR